jgi:hypothetical protein
MHTPIGILLLWTPQLAYSLSLYHLVADQLDGTELNSTSTVVCMSVTTDTCFIMCCLVVETSAFPRFRVVWISTVLSHYCNGSDQCIARQQLRKHVPMRNNGSCVSVDECYTSLLGSSQCTNELAG